MSSCPSKKQDVVIDYLSEMVIEKMPCDQGGAGKKKRKSKSKNNNLRNLNFNRGLPY